MRPALIAAQSIDAERERLTLLGLRAVRPLITRARITGLRAWRRGADVPATIARELKLAVPQVSDAMVAAHLQGMLRSQVTARRALKDRVALADPYRAAVTFASRRLNLTDADLSSIREQYDRQARKVIDDLSTFANQKIGRAVEEVVESGLHTQGGTAVIQRAFDAAGIAPGSEHQVETVYRSQVQLAYSAGRWEANQDPAIDEILWGYEYVAVHDDRTRPTHLALDGFRARKDDPRWAKIMPPNGYNCRCTTIEAFDGDAEASAFGSLRPIRIDGMMVTPGADEGWEFNPGEVFAGLEAA